MPLTEAYEIIHIMPADALIANADRAPKSIVLTTDPR